MPGDDVQRLNRFAIPTGWADEPPSKEAEFQALRDREARCDTVIRHCLGLSAEVRSFPDVRRAGIISGRQLGKPGRGLANVDE